MDNKIIDCKSIRDNILKNIKKEIKDKNLSLACIYITNDENSLNYLNQIKKLAFKLNVNIVEINILDNETKISNKIDLLNKENTINGIILLKPSTHKFNYNKLNKMIIYNKNVDNIDMPITTHAVMEILNTISNIKDKKISIIGRGNLVGKPLYNYLKNNNYNVVQCHSKTKNIKSITKNSDILISAIGKAHYIDSDFIKEGSVIIDVGTSFKNNKICGDINFDDVINKVNLITKVPGGIGTLTTMMLFKNLIELNKKTK